MNMIRTKPKPAQETTPEERICLALDQAHKLVCDALRDVYHMRRINQLDGFAHRWSGDKLRGIISDLEEVANRFDAEVGQ